VATMANSLESDSEWAEKKSCRKKLVRTNCWSPNVLLLWHLKGITFD